MKVLFKRCFSCNKFSYSSTAERTWICPYCGEDITGTTANPAEIEGYESYGEEAYLEEPDEVLEWEEDEWQDLEPDLEEEMEDEEGGEEKN